MRVPFEPTAFPSAPHLFDLTVVPHKLRGQSITLHRMKCSMPKVSRRADCSHLKPAQLDSLLQPFALHRFGRNQVNRHQLAGGGTIVVFLWLRSTTSTRTKQIAPPRPHGGLTVEGAIVGTHHTELLVLGSPVEGTDGSH